MAVAPLELLLGLRTPARVRVLGHSAADELLPTSTGADGGAADLVLLLPGSRERQRASLAAAAESAASSISGDGYVYLVIPGRLRALGARALRRAGLRVVGEYAHLAADGRTRYLVPLPRAARGYALGEVVLARPLQRRLVRMLPRPVLELCLPRVGLLAAAGSAPPPGRWLRDLASGRGADGPTLIATSWRSPGSSVGHCFADGAARPWGVAKVSAHAATEVASLNALGRKAADAGARVPELLGHGERNGVTVLVATHLTGAPAAAVLRRRRRDLEPVIQAVASWLARWHALSARPGEVTAALLERELAVPARELGLADQLPRYAASLDRLCSRLQGRLVSLVAAHRDLTTWNLLLEPGLPLGVLDWETAVEAALPLGDLFYALVDAVAATAGFRDRPAAAHACFSARGEHTVLAGKSRTRSRLHRCRRGHARARIPCVLAAACVERAKEW